MTKKIITSFLFCILLGSAVFADNLDKMLKNGINEYKDGNYLGSIQTMQKVLDENPGSAIAYYYRAISYVQIGKFTEALEDYRTVITLAPKSQLAKYAKIGQQVMKPVPEKASILPKVKKTSKREKKKQEKQELYSEKVKADMQKKNLKFIINKLNQKQKVEPSELEDFDDFSPNKSSMGTPSQDEIAKAYQVLKRAGINPQMASNMNPQAMQMSLLNSAMGGMNGMGGMGGNQQNSMNNMNIMPLLMMMQNQNQNPNQNGQNNNYDPEFMQSMISNMMMPNMMNVFDSKNNNNNY